MDVNYTNCETNGEDRDFISFSSDSSSPSNWRKTPFKSYPPHNFHQDCSSPHGSPQGFSSPINQRNFQSHRRGGAHLYDDRFKGNYYNRGCNFKSRNDNRKAHNNQSININESANVVISNFFHPSMVQDPWTRFQTNSARQQTFQITNADKEIETVKVTA
ncbi:hypothetical protein Bhyg_03138 [Pseudolycoriella hygida]|uniref:Uncharacterized protein n=1 Tax=Pseudolycoriella hygida TaxID=35572 RepID=A0A9Q0NEJ2_9DIPT|nr:hypothetical protein Bhyg_03138 [Pseudolycoriella hygida]